VRATTTTSTPGRAARIPLALAGLAVLAACRPDAAPGPAERPSPSAAPAASASPGVAEPPAPPAPARFLDALDVTSFRKGSVHAHSSASDGKNPPRDVYAWYRDHGYAFAVVSDHNQRTPPERFRDLERPGFVLVAGEEVTMRGAGKAVHVNALCTRSGIGDAPRLDLERFATVGDALRWAVAATRAQGAIAVVNHPNFTFAFGADDLPAARGARLLEIWSGHPTVQAEGDRDHPSEEAIWDAALAKGEDFVGVAVDDTHALGGLVAPEWRAFPGRGFVDVFADETSERAICDALARGRLVASSGPRLTRLRVEGDAMSVWPAAAARIEFVGLGGAVLAAVDAPGGGEARYRLAGTEARVRARVVAADGRRAWTASYRTTLVGAAGR
jgi:hypothetical protein